LDMGESLMVLLTPHPIKQIYGLRDRNWPPWGKSKQATPTDDWDNRAGLVLWLTDSGKGASVWQDSSGAGNHGTVYGATTPPAATPGALGYTFDGVDDYIDISHDFTATVTGITLGAWVNAKATSNLIQSNALLVFQFRGAGFYPASIVSVIVHGNRCFNAVCRDYKLL